MLAVALTLGVAAALTAATPRHGAGAPAPSAAGRPATEARYIVEGASTAAAVAAVAAAHGALVAELAGVHGATAELTAAAAAGVAARRGMRVYPDLPVTLAGSLLGSHPSGVFTTVTGATTLRSSGITGAGVTVAVLDTGIDNVRDLSGRLIGGVDLAGAGGWSFDGYGHGTFVAGLIASSGASSGGLYTGEAPGADLVSIKVAGANGVTDESTVIRGVDWAIGHRSSLGIRVLNLSLGTEPQSPSADDPLDQEVENAWDSGIVVVTSAGNDGPGNGTISSPGNDPLVITVGALDDGASTSPSAWSVPAFSSVGPTLYDGWFKPDLVAPGRSVVSLLAPGSLIALLNLGSLIGTANFVGSGTSFSSAIVSGIVALLLQQYPRLTPNQVKAALLLGTLPGPVGDPFVDGHGVAYAPGAAAVAGQVNLNQWAAANGETSFPPASVSLQGSWAVSTWNPSLWSGAAWNASGVGASAAGSATTTVSGAAWNGAAWNGAAWNGAAWNGAEWNGAAWNGAEWNGSSWNGAAWNGAAWNGAAWNGVSFDSANWG